MSRANAKGRTNKKENKNAKGKFDYSPDQSKFISNISGNKTDSFDYLQTQSHNKVELSKTANKNDLYAKRYSESPEYIKNALGASSNLGIYQNKTFYTVSQPKRAGTTFACYQEEAKRKRAIKKFRGKINISNNSNSTTPGLYPQKQKLPDAGSLQNTANYKTTTKGNEKVFMPINEVLNQARMDQISNNHTLSDILKNLSSTRKNKPSILENINNAVNKELANLNRSRGTDVLGNDQSLTQDEIDDLKKNLNLMNIQKSVMGSAGADKRESRPSNNSASKTFNPNTGKKSSSSCGVRTEISKSEAANLYTRDTKSDLKMKGIQSNTASRNNAYNSLVD